MLYLYLFLTAIFMLTALLNSLTACLPLSRGLAAQDFLLLLIPILSIFLMQELTSIFTLSSLSSFIFLRFSISFFKSLLCVRHALKVDSAAFIFSNNLSTDFFFYIKRALAKGQQKHIKKIPFVARLCKEDSRRNKSKGWRSS